MNPYAVAPLISSTIILSLGIFVFIKNRKSKVNLWWIFLCLSLWSWLFSHVIGFSTKSVNLANLLGKIAYLGVTTIPITFYFFVRHLLKLKTTRFLYGSILTTFIFIVWAMLKTDWIISGSWKYYFSYCSYYPKIGKFHALYQILFFLLPIQAFILLYKAFQDKNNTYARAEINQFKCVFWGVLLAWVTGPLDFLPMYGIEIYPPGFFCVTPIIIFISYAILKYQLMDIKVIIQKSLVYSILVALMTAGYLIFVLLISNLFQGLVGYQSFLVNLFTIFTIALLFNPLRNKIQRFLDKRFFKGTLESLTLEQETLKERLFHTEKLAYVGKLAAEVVHEIKNPLMVIKTYVDFLPKKIQDPAFVEKFQDTVRGEVEKMNNLTHRLLDLAKPRGMLMAGVNLSELIDSTLSALDTQLSKGDIQVKKDYYPEQPILQGDKDYLKQVFFNLFINSASAMESQPQEKARILSIKTYPESPDWFNLDISDTGCGISEGNLKKLFTLFFSTKEEGCGLGLVISYEIIKNHNGNISVKSQLGKGTTFTISLPVVK